MQALFVCLLMLMVTAFRKEGDTIFEDEMDGNHEKATSFVKYVCGVLADTDSFDGAKSQVQLLGSNFGKVGQHVGNQAAEGIHSSFCERGLMKAIQIDYGTLIRKAGFKIKNMVSAFKSSKLAACEGGFFKRFKKRCREAKKAEKKLQKAMKNQMENPKPTNQESYNADSTNPNEDQPYQDGMQVRQPSFNQKFEDFSTKPELSEADEAFPEGRQPYNGPESNFQSIPKKQYIQYDHEQGVQSQNMGLQSYYEQRQMPRLYKRFLPIIAALGAFAAEELVPIIIGVVINAILAFLASPEGKKLAVELIKKFAKPFTKMALYGNKQAQEQNSDEFK